MFRTIDVKLIGGTVLILNIPWGHSRLSR